MREAEVKRTSGGLALLNAGCGQTWSPEWTNLDISAKPGVLRHDLKSPLPFPSAVFDGVYSSHVLEHLNPEDGRKLLMEMRRVLVPGGVCRIVVPDYERACREYLNQLELAIRAPDPVTVRRYQWCVIELVDQFVRERSGGMMLEVLRSGDFDETFIRSRHGDEFEPYYGRSGSRGGAESPGRASSLRSEWRRLRRRIKAVFVRPKSPAETGELHRWAYDRFSLRRLMEDTGLIEVGERTFDDSRIPGWASWSLDAGREPGKPRKPDSLFMEGVKAP